MACFQAGQLGDKSIAVHALHEASSDIIIKCSESGLNQIWRCGACNVRELAEGNLGILSVVSAVVGARYWTP